MAQAYFGKPAATFVPGGAHIAVYLVPVLNGQLVVFDVTASAARGRWLPWNILGFGTNPYEAAAELADLWCGGAISDLRLVDAMSFSVPPEGWELALVFRAELDELPDPDDARRPLLFESGKFDAIGNFDPVDVESWVGGGPEPGLVARAGGLVF